MGVAPGVGTMAKTPVALKEMVGCLKSQADVGGTDRKIMNCGNDGRVGSGGLGGVRKGG